MAISDGTTIPRGIRAPRRRLSGPALAATERVVMFHAAGGR